MTRNWKNQTASLTIGKQTQGLITCIGMVNDVSEEVSRLFGGNQVELEGFFSAIFRLNDEILELIKRNIYNATSIYDSKEF